MWMRRFFNEMMTFPFNSFKITHPSNIFNLILFHWKYIFIWRIDQTLLKVHMSTHKTKGVDTRSGAAVGSQFQFGLGTTSSGPVVTGDP